VGVWHGKRAGQGYSQSGSVGKSVVTYCPGGSRFFGVCSCRLDLKPREIVVLSMVVMPFASGASCRAKAWHRCAPVRLFKERAIYSWCKTIGVSISFSRNFAKLKKSWQAAWRWRVSTRVGQYAVPSPDPGACLGGKASSPMGQQLPSPYGTGFSEGSGSRCVNPNVRPGCALLRACDNTGPPGTSPSDTMGLCMLLVGDSWHVAPWAELTLAKRRSACRRRQSLF
jgi:hypothetical protein